MGAHSIYAIDAFSGIGALGLAVKRCLPASRVVCYLENEATAITRLAARMEDGTIDQAPVWSDIAVFRAADFAERLVRATGQGVGLVYGGFPCQDISNAGNGVGINGTRSGLFFELVRIVREVRPRYLFLENVAALTVRGLDTVLGTHSVSVCEVTA